MRDDLEAVLAQLQAAGKPAELLAAVDERGRRPLHIAAFRDLPHMCGLLLEHGASADSPAVETERGHRVAEDGSNQTALHLAAAGGHMEVVELLLRGGAAREAGTTTGKTAMHFAAEFGQLPVLRLLLRAAAPGDFAELMAADRDGWTALHYAAFGLHPEAVSTLLEAGPAAEGGLADVTDNYGCTAAVWAGHFPGLHDGSGKSAGSQPRGGGGPRRREAEPREAALAVWEVLREVPSTARTTLPETALPVGWGDPLGWTALLTAADSSPTLAAAWAGNVCGPSLASPTRGQVSCVVALLSLALAFPFSVCVCVCVSGAHDPKRRAISASNLAHLGCSCL